MDTVRYLIFTNLLVNHTKIILSNINKLQFSVQTEQLFHQQRILLKQF